MSLIPFAPFLLSYFPSRPAHSKEYRTGRIGRPLENRVLEIMEKSFCVLSTAGLRPAFLFS
jgi:hypothetical protein